MKPPENHTRWAWRTATFFGAGYLTPGPGTYGSIFAILIWLWVGLFVHVSPAMFSLLTLLLAAIATAIGIPASTIVAREAGREDPGFVVIDEVAGQLLAAVLLSPTRLHALLALVLFRFFDISKPWPIGKLEELPQGTGIMLDDLGAGVFAVIVAAAVLHFFPVLR